MHVMYGMYRETELLSADPIDPHTELYAQAVVSAAQSNSVALEKHGYERGMWNTQSVTVGGLGAPSQVSVQSVHAILHAQSESDGSHEPHVLSEMLARGDGDSDQRHVDQLARLKEMWMGLKMAPRTQLDLSIKYSSVRFTQQRVTEEAIEASLRTGIERRARVHVQ